MDLFCYPNTNKSEAYGDQGIFYIASAGNGPLFPYCSSHLNKVFMDVFALLRGEQQHHPAVACSGCVSSFSSRSAALLLHLLGKMDQSAVGKAADRCVELLCVTAFGISKTRE